MANVSVVQKFDGHRALNFASKQDFIATIEAKNTITDADVHVEITCQCGKLYSYDTANDIPASNVICGCGRKVLIYGN